MSSDIDPYAVLGVPKDATLPEVKSAHRKLVLKCHPDKIKDESLRNEAQDEFQKVQHAYELLSDETRRTKYDQKVRLAELRREMKEQQQQQQQQQQRSYSSPRASHSREYRDGRIYEERMPADAFFEEAMSYHPDEPRTTARKHDDFGRRPRTDEKKKPKGATSSSPFSGFRAAREAARDGAKATHSSRAKYRTKERKREAYEKYERSAYVSDSSDSGASFDNYKHSEKPTSSSRRSKPTSTRHPTDPRIYEEDDDDGGDYSDQYESKYDKLHTTAWDYIRRSKGTVPIDVDPRNHRSSHSPPPRSRDYESAEPEQTSSARRSGTRSKRPSRETVRPSSSRNGSYEHLDTPPRTVPSMPTAATSPAATKTARPSLQASRSATTAGYSRSGSKRDAQLLVNMVYADGTSRSSKLRTADSGYSSPGTPEMGTGTSPPKNSTRYRVVTEPDTVLLEPEIPPSQPSARYQRGYSPPHPYPHPVERPPASVRAGSKPTRSHTTYVPESRHEKPIRQSTSARLSEQVDAAVRTKDSKDVKYPREYAREYGPDYMSRESYHPRGYPYQDYRQSAPGRRQSAYA